MTDMSTNPLNAIEQVKKNWGWFLFLGIIFVIGGIFAIATPLVATLAVTIVVGISLAFVGVFQIIQAWSIRSWGGFIWQLIIGIIAVVGGIYMWWNPIPGAIALTIVMAAVFLAKGLMQVILGFQLRPHQGWGWMLVSGILSIIIGVLIWSEFPDSSAFAVGTLAGIALIFSGWTYIMIAMMSRRA